MVRRRLAVVVVALIIFSPFLLLRLVRDPDLSAEKNLAQNISVFKELINNFQGFNRHRMEDIASLSSKINAIVPELHNMSDVNLSRQEREFLANYSVAKAVRSPSIYDYLPHLLRDPKSTSPGFLMSKGRMNVDIVLGIPTVQREVQSYLLSTLTDLLKGMSPSERESTLIVVFVAESDITYVHKVASLVEKSFEEHLESGLIEIMSPPASFYPDFSTLKATLGDKIDRVRWRTKQNLDYAFLMMYAQVKGLYYVQLEDDVLTRKNFINTMKSFAVQKTTDHANWFVLDFCQLGFIGKMFKCAELPFLIQFFLMFHSEKPVDWLLDYLVQTKSCSLDQDAKACRREKAKLWIRYKPSLFQHIGTHSSLKGKVQKLKDKQFGKVTLHTPHTNPPAVVETNIKPYKSFTFQKAYRGETYFWGLLPQQGDEMTINFNSPVNIERFLFRSGNVEHPSDMFFNTTVEVLPLHPSTGHGLPASDLKNYLVVGRFSDLGIAKSTVNRNVGPVTKMKLRVHTESDSWAILSEIEIKERKSR